MINRIIRSRSNLGVVTADHLHIFHQMHFRQGGFCRVEAERAASRSFDHQMDQLELFARSNSVLWRR